MTQTFTIADSFDATARGHCVDLNAPLPLSYHSALRRAAQMRNSNPTAMTYSAVCEVMATYHGWRRSQGWWRRELLSAELVERRPRGGSEANLNRGGVYKKRRLRAVA